MSREYWFRTEDEVSAIDWSRSARELDVPIDVARVLFARAMRCTTDLWRAETLYLGWLRAAAAARRPAAPRPAPGRRTRVTHEAGDAGRSQRSQDVERRDSGQRSGEWVADPGKWTRVLFERGDDEPPPRSDEVQHLNQTLAARVMLAPDTAEHAAADPPVPRSVTQTAEGGVDRVPVRRSGGAAAPPDLGAPQGWQVDPSLALGAHALGMACFAPAPTAAAIYRDVAGDGRVAPDARALVDAALRGGAESLHPRIRAALEAMLGRDLGDVRIHRGGVADQAAHALGARAFAIGRDVVFRDGAYDPGSLDGARLIAHEVVHTQQAETGATEPRISDPGDATEREADALADRFVERLHGTGAPRPTLGPFTSVRAARDPRSHAPGAGEPVHAVIALRHAAVSRMPGGGGPSAPTAIPPGGQPVDQVGIVAWDDSPKLRLRATPSTSDGNILGELAFNTHVQVIKRFDGDWLFVSTADGRMGYVAAQYVWSAPEHPLPEPNAQLHRVEAGTAGTAIAVAERYFRSAGTDWGHDLRFYVNVLAAVNRVTVPSSVDGWRSVQFQAGQFIWIPSVRFARSLHGVVNSGSYSYEAATGLGIASALERLGEFLTDLQLALGLSGKYMQAAIEAHVEEAILDILVSLVAMAIGAIGLLAAFSAGGALVGGPAGAAVGFEIALAILEWIGLGFLVKWIADSAASIRDAFGAFLGTVWDAHGNRGTLELGAFQFADAIGVLMGVLVQALVMWAVSVGVKAAIKGLQGTALGKAFGETRLGKWLDERITRYRRGETALPGPGEVLLRIQARSLAGELGIAEDLALKLLHALDAQALRGLNDEFGAKLLDDLGSRTPEVLEAFARALRATGDDPVARAALREGVGLNQKGTISNEAFRGALDAYTQFRGKYGPRVSGDFISRFWRLFAKNMDPAQAASEIRLAEDLLAGKTPLGPTTSVDALPDSDTSQVPEFRANTPDGAHLVENKVIGTEDGLRENGFKNNLGKANSQIRELANASSPPLTDGLIRLDGSEAGPTPGLTPDTIADWVNNKLPSPRGSRVVRWVEVFYNDGNGVLQRVVLELDAGPGGTGRFVLRPGAGR